MKTLEDNNIALKSHFTQGTGKGLAQEIDSLYLAILKIEAQARHQGFAEYDGHAIVFKNNSLQFKEFLDDAALANIVGALRTTASELLLKTRDLKIRGILMDMS